MLIPEIFRRSIEMLRIHHVRGDWPSSSRCGNWRIFAVTNKKAKGTDVFCSHCPTKVENVEHFIHECILYREERSKLESTLTQSKEHPNFNNLPDLTKLQIILNVEAKDERSRDAILSYKTNLQKKMRHCILICFRRHPECQYGNIKLLNISISTINALAYGCFIYSMYSVVLGKTTLCQIN